MIGSVVVHVFLHLGAKQRAVCSTFQCSPLQASHHHGELATPNSCTAAAATTRAGRYSQQGCTCAVRSTHLVTHRGCGNGMLLRLVTVQLRRIVPPCGRPHRFPTQSLERSRSMHDESLHCIFPVLGCKHKPDVLCAFQASSRLNITAGPSIIAWTLPALRRACLSPTPQYQDPSRNDSDHA